MQLSEFIVAPCGILLLAAATGAADLTKLDRTIKKEPAYQSSPKYCLLVFGPEARSRVWLVLDGDTLYVDRNGNGDLTEKGEQFKAPAFQPSTHPAHERERSIEVGDLTVGNHTHARLVVSQTQYRRKVYISRGTGASTPQEWQVYLDSIRRQIPDGMVYMVSIDLDVRCYSRFKETNGKRVNHFAWIDPQGQLCFADRPQDAPVVHLGGPLTLRLSATDRLRRGSDLARVTLCLGTPGLGPGSFATMCYDLVPKDVHPVVEVRFPVKEASARPLIRKYILKERC